VSPYFVNPGPVPPGYCQCGDSADEPGCDKPAGFACLTPDKSLVLACPYHAEDGGWVAKWCWVDADCDTCGNRGWYPAYDEQGHEGERYCACLHGKRRRAND
jgi:hypothetical protein